MRLVRKPNSIGFIADDRHLYLFKPAAAHGTYSAWGFHLRRRTSRGWVHVILRLNSKGRARDGQLGTRTWEIQRYETTSSSHANGNNTRLTWKRFLRVKVGKGGEKLPPLPVEPSVQDAADERSR